MMARTYSADDIYRMNKLSPQRQPKNSLFRAATVMVRSHATKASPEAVAKQMYTKDHGLDHLIARAASAPASLGTPAWAGVVGHDEIFSQLIQKITALSAAAGLMMAGMKVDLSGLASISIPGRTYNPNAAGAWVGEGQPIPLRQPSIAAGPKLTPHKLAVLTTYSREMAEADSLESFATVAIKEGAAALLDLKMFSTDVGTATSPPGILLGATAVTASTAATPWAISTDVGNLVGALAQYGGGLEPILICSPSQAASLRMWKQESFYTILASVALAPGTIVAVESSSFVSGLDGVPEFATSTGATLHMEDTTPADIASSGGTVAQPVKNLYQTDLIGLRMILRASWGMRNQKHVAVVSGVQLVIDLVYLARLRAEADEVRADLAARETNPTHEEVMATTQVPNIHGLGYLVPDIIHKEYTGKQLPIDDTNNDYVELPPLTDEQIDIIAAALADIKLDLQSRIEDAIAPLVQRISVLEGQLSLMTTLLGTKSFEASEVIRKIRVP